MNRILMTRKRSRIIQRNQTYYTLLIMPGVAALRPAWPAGVECCISDDSRPNFLLPCSGADFSDMAQKAAFNLPMLRRTN
jgi:hypothetical protein